MLTYHQHTNICIAHHVVGPTLISLTILDTGFKRCPKSHTVTIYTALSTQYMATLLHIGGYSHIRFCQIHSARPAWRSLSSRTPNAIQSAAARASLTLPDIQLKCAFIYGLLDAPRRNMQLSQRWRSFGFAGNDKLEVGQNS